jgi:cytochrome c-type biogenesis protein CcmH/NrfF
MIRDEVASGKQEKEVYKKLQETYGDTVLYTPPFDSQTAILWLLPVSVLPITSQHTYCQNNMFSPLDSLLQAQKVAAWLWKLRCIMSCINLGTGSPAS